MLGVQANNWNEKGVGFIKRLYKQLLYRACIVSQETIVDSKKGVKLRVLRRQIFSEIKH